MSSVSSQIRWKHYVHPYQTEGLPRRLYTHDGKFIYSGTYHSSLLADKFQYPKMPIYFDHDVGERQHDVDAVKRFYRLAWGGWIRPRIGRRKKLWRKPDHMRWWQRQHILCDDQMCQMLEKMITPEFKKQRYFVNDPYEPYHKRHGMDVVPAGQRKVSTSYMKSMYEY